MIASMFNLDERLAELRPSEAELRLARQRRDAAFASHRGSDVRPSVAPRTQAPQVGGRPSRVAAG